jgi:hypothetical protein
LKFTDAQLEQYQTNGYAIIDCPFPAGLTDDCMRAVRKVSSKDETFEKVWNGNHYRLKPQTPESRWCDLDHSLPFMQIILHVEIIELARQLEGDKDLYLRNGGIHEMAPGRTVHWHSDGGHAWVEFMHYFAGVNPRNGCLRVVPGSHLLPAEEQQTLIELARKKQGIELPKEPFTESEDAELPGEVSLEVGPHQVIVRSSRILHSTWINKTHEGRLMSHWLFRIPSIDDHRFRFEEHLTDELIGRLSPEQKEILWLGKEFEINPGHQKERERDLGNVYWGVV